MYNTLLSPDLEILYIMYWALIRLRNLSGIIIIDFINMQETSSVLALMKTLEGLLKKDPVRTVLVDITKLGLVEITRKKTEPPLSELLTCQEKALIL